MKVIIAKLVTVLSLLSGCQAEAKGVFTTENTVIVGREITSATMLPVLQRVLQLVLQKEVAPELNVIISSPGGSVFTGYTYISTIKALRARGTKVNCYVAIMAASMAFHMLTQCDTRTVLAESVLLWHRARVMLGDTPLTSTLAHDIALDLGNNDDKILREVTGLLSADMTKEEIEYHFNKETLHIGDVLCGKAPHFCTAVDVVPGLIEIMNTKGVVKAEAPFNPFGRVVEVLYIWNPYLGGK